MAKDVEKLKPYVRSAHDIIESACQQQKRVFLEGTQGTALSLFHGFYPHVTSRDTTVAGCLAEAGISPSRVRKVVMVCRTYPIRVQDPDGEGKTSGPMSQEISLPEIERRSGIALNKLQKTETTSTTKRKRRICEFDWVLLKKAAELNAPTDIALTFVDYLSIENQAARRFEQLTQDTVRFIQEIERVAEAPVSLISTRFHHRSIIDRRAW
jgi:adenylosuccinate synthase